MNSAVTMNAGLTFGLTVFMIFVGLGYQQRDGCNTPNIQLMGDDIICPGEVGFFECTVTNSGVLTWSISTGDSVGFLPSDSVAMDKSVDTSGSIAFLRSVSQQGNFTAMLRYKPDPSMKGAVNVSCLNGDENWCRKTLTVIGTDDMAPPTNFTVKNNPKNITLSWDHETKDLVDHYIISLNSEVFANQVIRVYTESFTVPQVPYLLSSVNITAVSMCQNRSPPLPYEFISQGSGSVDMRHLSAFGILLLQCITYYYFN